MLHIEGELLYVTVVLRLPACVLLRVFHGRRSFHGHF
jgi:hypothetical protein